MKWSRWRVSPLLIFWQMVRASVECGHWSLDGLNSSPTSQLLTVHSKTWLGKNDNKVGFCTSHWLLLRRKKSSCSNLLPVIEVFHSGSGHELQISKHSYMLNVLTWQMFSMSKFKRSPNVSERRFNVQLFFARITLQTVKVEPNLNSGGWCSIFSLHRLNCGLAWEHVIINQYQLTGFDKHTCRRNTIIRP